MIALKNKLLFLLWGSLMLPLATGCAGHCEQNNQRIEQLYKAGRQYISQNRNDSALYCFMEAYDLQNQHTDIDMKIRLNSNLGLLLGTNRLYPSALNYYKEALHLCLSTSDSLKIAYAYANLGNICALNHSSDGAKDALPYLDKALSFGYKYKHLNGYVYQSKGMYYYYTAHNDSALHYLRCSLLHPTGGVNEAIRYSLMGHVYLHMGNNLDSAEHYLYKSLNARNTFRLKSNCYNALYDIAVQRGDSVKKNLYAAICLRNKDSIMHMENRIKPPMLQLIAEREKQKAEMLSEKNTLRAIILSIAALAATFLFYVPYKRRNTRSDILPEKVESNTMKIPDPVWEIRRQEWADKLNKKFQTTDNSPHLSRRHKTFIRNKCNEMLHLDEWETFSSLFNENFNDIVDKIKGYYGRNLPQTQSSIQFCCLLLLDVSKENIEIILNYSHPDAYRKRCNLLNKRFVDKRKDEDLHAFLIRLMQR